MSVSTARSAATVVAAVVLGLVTASCGSTQDDAVTRVAAGFAQAVTDRNGERACALLAPATRTELQQSSGEPCAQAVLEEAVAAAGPRVEVGVYGTAARVRFEADTLFLARFASGWRVLAAACSPMPGDRPYDCQVKGG